MTKMERKMSGNSKTLKTLKTLRTQFSASRSQNTLSKSVQRKEKTVESKSV